MNVGIISDSHDNLVALRAVLKELTTHGIEMLIHLGDIISPFAVKLMKDLLPGIKVVAVRGNNDGDVHQIGSLFNQYGWVFKSEPTIVELNRKKVLLVHGYGDAETTRMLIDALARSLDVNLILYGHTHQPHVEQISNKLVINPGEVCGLLTGNVSYAVVDLSSMRAEIRFARVNIDNWP